MSAEEVKCPKCNGEGKTYPCWRCEGKGGWWGVSGGEKVWETCAVCWGSEKSTCDMCSGRGWIFRN